MTTEMGTARKRPPVTVRQNQCVYLTDKHGKAEGIQTPTAKLSFATLQSGGLPNLRRQQPKDQLGDLIFLSSHEASLASRS